MTTTSPDPGLSAERTLLAWQRTALAVTAGSALMARLTFGDLGVAALLLLGAAVALSGWILLDSRTRGRRERLRGGVASAVLALAVVLMAATELIALLRHSLG